MDAVLKDYARRLEALAREQGLDFHPIDFEQVPESVMTEVAVYGLPVRMPHWSFGVRYIYQFVRQRMGNSRLFEVMFPGNPSRAYLADRNGLEENTLVTAHVVGHADFAHRNLLFASAQSQVGGRIVEQAATHARQIGDAIERHGQDRVEAVLDAALAVEQHVDVTRGLRRERFAEYAQDDPGPEPGAFRSRYERLPGDSSRPAPPRAPRRNPLPPAPESDLLWFIAEYAPDLQGWERDILLAVREESFFFHPIFACQIMNEGWASYWHARLLRQADFLPHGAYLEALKAHSDVVRPFAGDNEVSLAVNPYHLGFAIWEDLIERHGIEHAFRVAAEDDDFGFIRNHLDADLAARLSLFTWNARRNGEVSVESRDIEAVREALLAKKYNFGAPSIAVASVHVDGTLELRHDHAVDGRGLDLQRATRVLDYLHAIWRRPVQLHTTGADGGACTLSAGGGNTPGG